MTNSIEELTDEERKNFFSKSAQTVFDDVKKAHDDTHAIRKASGMQYFTHPEAVAKIATAYKGSPSEIKAAMAHDILEDTQMSYSELKRVAGLRAAQLVKEVTNVPEKLLQFKAKYGSKGKEYYMNEKIVGLSESALFVKLCDILHNTLDNATPSTKERMKMNILYLKENRIIPERLKELFYSVCNALGISVTETL